MARWVDPTETDLYYAGNRPAILGSRGMVASGHCVASLTGMSILENGGNAVDAAVAAGLCLNVLQPNATSIAGVAPIMIYSRNADEVVTIDGLGRWPQEASIAFFEEKCGDDMPPGILRSVVPAAADAWITALERYGSMTFGQVAAHALELAREGFPVCRYLYRSILGELPDYRRWPSTAAVLLSDGNAPAFGSILVQSDLAATLKRMISAEDHVQSSGRLAGLSAARDEFYQGETAQRMISFARAEGGLLQASDLKAFRVRIERPQRTSYRGYQVFSCGPWCQGPVLLQTLNILEGYDISALDHNGPHYLHLLIESLKLAFADREAFYGDPEFIDVPMEGLLSKEYATERRRLIHNSRATPGMPSPGHPHDHRRGASAGLSEQEFEHRTGPRSPEEDTSFVCVVDRWGNAAAATPSDGAASSPFVPGVGCVISSRGSQSWLERGHPSALAPGKRPRLTPCPAMVFEGDRLFLVFGTPGGDIQPQAMLQVLVNVIDFGVEVQTALEMDRAHTCSFPDSFWPHNSMPGHVGLEAGLVSKAANTLSLFGHDVQRLSPWERHQLSSVCAIQVRGDRSILIGAADNRRESYAVGW